MGVFSRVINLDIYGYQYHIVIGSVDDLKYYAESIGLTDLSVSDKSFEAFVMSGLSNEYRAEFSIVYINDDKCRAHTLAHESFHLAYTILRNAGVRLSRNSEEAFAYLIDWIFQTLMFSYQEYKGIISFEDSLTALCDEYKEQLSANEDILEFSDKLTELGKSYRVGKINTSIALM